MSNIASVIKAEVSRLSRKEVKSETANLKKASAQYRTDIAELKRRITTLEQQISRLSKFQPDIAEDKTKTATNTARFSANGFATLRKRLGLSAAQVSRLMDVTAQTIYSWEAGHSIPRAAQMERIVVLRGMSKRDVASILQQQTN